MSGVNPDDRFVGAIDQVTVNFFEIRIVLDRKFQFKWVFWPLIRELPPPGSWYSISKLKKSWPQTRKGSLNNKQTELSLKNRVTLLLKKYFEILDKIEITQYFPREGWVEECPDEILNSCLKCIDQTLDEFLQLNYSKGRNSSNCVSKNIFNELLRLQNFNNKKLWN